MGAVPSVWRAAALCTGAACMWAEVLDLQRCQPQLQFRRAAALQLEQLRHRNSRVSVGIPRQISALQGPLV